jgi:hypothetical protein
MASTSTRPGTGKRPGRRLPRLLRLRPGQVDALLAVAVSGAVVTGLVSWAVGSEWARLWTALHAMLGTLILVLAPAKIRGSVRSGLRRGRPSRWLSALFGLVVLAVIGLGFAHSTGAWTGVGYWSPLWTHVLLAALTLPLLLWHLGARPVRRRAVDLDRRMLLGTGVAVGAAAVTVGSVELSVRALGLPGATRRFTGSHEIASMDPARMPTVSWIDDTPPPTDPEAWELVVDGGVVAIDELRALARPVEAALDCTGGWWSLQAWDAVPVADLLESSARSFVVRSATGYTRAFPMRDAAAVHLAVGYGGRPLRRGHGAPLRIVAPGRRGPWWVKWVTAVEASDRPWWLQSPFPTT